MKHLVLYDCSDGSPGKIESIDKAGIVFNMAHAAANRIEADPRNSAMIRWNEPDTDLADAKGLVPKKARPVDNRAFKAPLFDECDDVHSQKFDSGHVDWFGSLNFGTCTRNGLHVLEKEKASLRMQLFRILDEEMWAAGKEDKIQAMFDVGTSSWVCGCEEDSCLCNWKPVNWDFHIGNPSEENNDLVKDIKTNFEYAVAMLRGSGSWGKASALAEKAAKAFCKQFDNSLLGSALKQIEDSGKCGEDKAAVLYERYSTGTRGQKDGDDESGNQAKYVRNQISQSRDLYEKYKEFILVTDSKGDRRTAGNYGLCKVVFLILTGRVGAVFAKSMLRYTGSPFVALYFSEIARIRNVALVSFVARDEGRSLWDAAIREFRRYQLASDAHHMHMHGSRLPNNPDLNEETDYDELSEAND